MIHSSSSSRLFDVDSIRQNNVFHHNVDSPSAMTTYSTLTTTTHHRLPNTKAILEAQNRKARMVTFYRNGKQFEHAVRLSFVIGKTFPHLDALMDYLTEKCPDIPYGVRYLFTLTGKMIFRLEDLEHNQCYVMSGVRTFHFMNYGVPPEINSNSSNNSKPSDTSSSSVMSFNGSSKSDPIKQPRKAYYNSRYRSIENLARLRQNGGDYSNGYASSKNYDMMLDDDVGKVVTLVNGRNPSIKSRVILNLITPKSFESVLKDLGEAVQLSHPKKLWTETGRQVRSISQLRREMIDHEIFFLDTMIKNSFTRNNNNNDMVMTRPNSKSLESLSTTRQPPNNNTINNHESLIGGMSSDELNTMLLTSHVVDKHQHERRNLVRTDSAPDELSASTNNCNFHHRYNGEDFGTTTDSSLPTREVTSSRSPVVAQTQNNESTTRVSSRSAETQTSPPSTSSVGTNVSNSNSRRSSSTNRVRQNHQNHHHHRSFDDDKKGVTAQASRGSSNKSNTTRRKSSFSSRLLVVDKNDIFDDDESDERRINLEGKNTTRTTSTQEGRSENKKLISRHGRSRETSRRGRRTSSEGEEIEAARVDDYDENESNRMFAQDVDEQSHKNVREDIVVDKRNDTTEASNESGSEEQLQPVDVSLTVDSEELHKRLRDAYRTMSQSSIRNNENDDDDDIDEMERQTTSKSTSANRTNHNNNNLTSVNVPTMKKVPKVRKINSQQKGQKSTSNPVSMNASRDSLSKSISSSKSASSVVIAPQRSLSIKEQHNPISGTINRTSNSRSNSPDINEITNNEVEKELTIVDDSKLVSIALKGSYHVEADKINGTNMPDKSFFLCRVLGYKSESTNGNLVCLSSGEVSYTIGGICVVWNPNTNSQRFYCEHERDIEGIACHNDHDDTSRSIVATIETIFVNEHDQRIHIRIWSIDPSKIKTITTLDEPLNDQRLVGLWFTPIDSSLMIIVGNQESIVGRFWNWQRSTKKVTTCFTHEMLPEESIISSIFHPRDDDKLVTFGRQHLILWQLMTDKTGIERKTFLNCYIKNSKSKISVSSAVFLVDDTLLTSNSSGELIIWAPVPGDDGTLDFMQRVFLAHESAISGICPLANLLLTADYTGGIRLWRLNEGIFDLVTSTQLPETASAILAVDAVCMQSSVAYVVTGYEQIVRVEFSSNNESQPQLDIVLEGLSTTQGGMMKLATHPHEKSFFSTSTHDNSVCKWHPIFGLEWKTFLKSKGISIAVHPKGGVIAIGCVTGEVIVMTVTEGTQLSLLPISESNITCLEYSPNGQVLTCGSSDGLMYLLPVTDDGLAYQSLSVLKSAHPLVSIQWSEDNQYIMTNVDNNGNPDLVLWDLPNSRYMQGVDSITTDMDWRDPIWSHSENSESPRPLMVPGWPPGFPGIPGMPGMPGMPPTSRPGDPMMPPTSMAGFPPGHPFAPHPLMGPHPFGPHGPNPFAFLPPGMPPYFAPPWFPPAAPRLGMPPSIPSPSSHPSSSSKSKSPVPKDDQDRHSTERRDSTADDDDIEPQQIPRGPSPEPKVEDSECHRSQSAIFLKHWNRGDYNSCARTDLTFKPVPDSQLARKREERARKAADREREEQKKLAAESRLSGGGHGESSHHGLNPFDRPTSRMMPAPETPASRHLSEYTRGPHAGLFSPGFPRTSLAGPMPGQSPSVPTSSAGGFPGFPGHPGSGNPSMDALLHYQMGLYGPLERARIEAEEREKREIAKREREMKEMEMKSRMAQQSAFEAQMADLQRRYGAAAAGHPSGGSGGLPHPFGLFPPGLTPNERERLGVPPLPEGLSQQQLQAEQRLQSERLAALSAATSDPVLRMQMANLASELHAHTHAHTHTHAHLHLHPSLPPHDPVAAAAAAAAMGGLPNSNSLEPSPASGLHTPHPSLLGSNPPPSVRPPAPPLAPLARGPESSLIHPSSGLLRPNFDEQLAHQLLTSQHHEQLSRQFLLERERLMAASAAASGNPPPF